MPLEVSLLLKTYHLLVANANETLTTHDIALLMLGSMFSATNAA